MNNFKIIFIMIAVVFMSNSCSKHEDEAIVDCLGDSILMKLKHSEDETNSKKINYSIEYYGSKTISSVTWTFGDGSPSETINSTTGAVAHTYSAAGTFEVKADVTISKEGGSCTTSPKKSITVN
jgi:hypothetical protein